MASVNVGEDDFMHVALAAKAAHGSGDAEGAAALDKLARKINAALTLAGSTKISKLHGMPRPELTWRDMPSTLEELS